MADKKTPFDMSDDQVAAAAGGARKTSAVSQIATSPGITDSLAAMTLSHSSDGKMQSIKLPDIDERLTQWLEDELLASNVRRFRFHVHGPW